MRVAILAGGRGTRFGAWTRHVPKPLLPVGGRPLLWHLLAYYAHHGYREAVVALGWQGEAVRQHFAEPAARPPGTTLRLVDTGLATATGGRVRRLAPHLGDGPFLLTWGDGVADLDLRALVAFHRSHGRLATVTAVHPPPRFGALALDGERVRAFEEKPKRDDEWVNGAFFVLERRVLDWIGGDDEPFETGALAALARAGELMAHRHEGFWACMDTPEDRARLEALWASGAAPWKVWSDPP